MKFFYSASREQLKRIEKAEALYLKAAKAAGNGKLVRYILEEDDEEEVDSEGEVQYNKVFPFYDKLPHSEANQLATRWTYKNDVKFGDKALISCGSRWYMIENILNQQHCSPFA